MRVPIISVVLTTLSTTIAATVSNIFAFPVGTWVENLTIRTSNGQLLASTIGNSHVWQVDPAQIAPTLKVASIPKHNAILGITEVQPDVFYVNAGVLDFQNVPETLGSYSVWKLNLTQYGASGQGTKVTPKLVADFPEAGFLNGATTLDAKKGLILLADSAEGNVWRLNVKTGEKKIIFANRLTRYRGTNKTDVNGLKIKDGYLFWTNPGRGIVGRAPISSKGVQTYPAEVITARTGPLDDFCLLPGVQNIGYITGNNTLRRFQGKQKIDFVDSALLKGSTACVISDSGRIFVSTSGGNEQWFAGNVTEPGRLIAVDYE